LRPVTFLGWWPSRREARDETVRDADYEKLVADLEAEILRGAIPVAILGLTPVTLRLLRSLAGCGLSAVVEAVYDASAGRLGGLSLAAPVRPLPDLARSTCEVLVVASDERKEELLEHAVPYLVRTPKVLVSGYTQFGFRDPLLDEVLALTPIPSLANGYPDILIHIYQCLRNAARLGLRGVVAEFGMFKGGTTMVMAQLIELLGTGWPVIGFDSFQGFPPRVSALDMYDDPGCRFDDVELIRSYLSRWAVEIVAGDIVETAGRLLHEDLVLTFIDTDNFTAARAAIDVVRKRTVPGGAIVFDHFAGIDRFRYTLGERMAAKTLLDDARYFNLHGTGVFHRQSLSGACSDVAARTRATEPSMP
jgi:O-methyltransferase